MPDPHFSQSNYTAILNYVDTQIRIQPAASTGDANTSAIPRMVRDWRVAQGNATVTAEYGMIGSRWVELLAASRVREWIDELDEREEQQSWGGQVFASMYRMLGVVFQRVHTTHFLNRVAGEKGGGETDGDTTEEEEEEDEMTPG